VEYQPIRAAFLHLEGGEEMWACRTIVFLGLCGSMLSLIGCGATIPIREGNASDELILPANHDFGDTTGLPVAARMVRYKAGAMYLDGEVPSGVLNGTALAVSSGDLLVHVDSPSCDRFCPFGKEAPQHVELTFRLARDQHAACDSDIQIGPIEAAVVDGAVMLAQTLLPLHPASSGIVCNGQFGVCAETWGDFDGSVSLEKLSFAFSKKRSEERFVEICHVPPGDPANQHTIVVGASAVERHLAHNDYLGPCETGGNVDNDGDGVADAVDECPDTPVGEDVYPNGCAVVLIAADAGPDVTVVEGETVSVTGSAQVLQGEYDPGNLVYVWDQTGGSEVPYESSGPLLTIQTAGVEGVLAFLLTVSTHDGLASCSDELVITVTPAQIVQVVAGKWHNIALLENGNIIPWGVNRYGQLGDGTLADSILDVDAGTMATLLARTDGTAWTVGNNALSDSAVPVEIVGVTDVVSVAAQNAGGILLGGDGTAWGFGDAGNAQCELAGEPFPGADGILGPIQVPGLPDNITAISAGNHHGLALDAEGMAWIWGSRFGCTPIPILDDVVTIAAGDSAYCLLARADGTAWGIGYNNFGQLGNGTTLSSFNTVTQVVGLSDVVDIAAGHAHGFFVTSDGTLWATGWNRYCQLGLEDEMSPAEPVFGTVVTEPTQVGLANVMSVAAGYTHSVAVQEDGTVWVWGSNSTGQLSGGTQSSFPSRVCTPARIELIGAQ
jgi:alpha-tubulin suppressor-like RCC1 family protein